MATNPPSEEKKLDSFKCSSESTMRRKRTVFNKEQLDILKKHFQKNPYPGIEEREELSRLTNIPEPRIHVWFQNRRARQLSKKKTRTSEFSTSSRQECLEDVSLGPIPEEDSSDQELRIPNASRCSSWTGEPSQETSPRSDFSFERRSAASTIEAACSYGYGISQSLHFDSSQNIGPSPEFQPCAFPETTSQGSFSQWPSSSAMQGTQGPEKYNTHSFFYEVKPPLHIQEQVEQVYSNYPSTFECAEEPSHQFQQPHSQQNLPQQPHPQQNYSHQPYFHQPSALQSLVPQAPTFQEPLNSLQELQDQTLPPPLVTEEEESYDSFNQQELHPIDVSTGTVGLGPTFLLPDEHLTVPQGTYVLQEHVPAPHGHWADPLGNQSDTLRDLAEEHRHH